MELVAVQQPLIFVHPLIAVVELMKVVCVLTLLPPAFEEFNTILKLPTPNVYDAFCVVLKVKAVLFPEVLVAFHCQVVGVLVEVSLNWTGSRAVPDVAFDVNEETGALTISPCISHTVVCNDGSSDALSALPLDEML